MKNPKTIVQRASLLCAAILAAVAISGVQPATLAAEDNALPVDEVVARLSDGPSEWAMFAFGDGEPIVARGPVRRGGVVLALPVRHARTGYLQDDIRLAGSDEVVLARGTAVFEQLERGKTGRDARTRVWCAIVADRASCVVNSRDGGAAVAAGEGPAYAPRSLSPQTPATSSRVTVDPAAATAFPSMEFVYSFVRWDDAYVYLEQGVKAEGRIVKLGDVRAPRRPSSALVSAGRGAVRIRPGSDAYSAVASIAAPAIDEATHLRRAAEAIARLPPGEGAAASPELLDAHAPPPPASTQTAAPTVSAPRVALPGPEPNRCMLASYEANAPGQSLRLAPGLFRERPTGEDFGRFFPKEAAQARLDGRAVIVCAIDQEGGLRCLVQSETPPGYGFGEAALKISTRFRVAERLSDGRPTAGGALRLPIRFCHP